MPAPSTPVYTLNLPATLSEGRVRLHVWSIAGSKISNPHSVIDFNYAPGNQLDAGEAQYYAFKADAGDSVTINCALNSGGAELFIWQPDVHLSAETTPCNNSITYNSSRPGEYLVMVRATSNATSYELSSVRDGIAGARRAITAVERVMIERPDVVHPHVKPFSPPELMPIPDEPISDESIPSEPNAVTLQTITITPPVEQLVYLSISLLAGLTLVHHSGNS